MKTTTNPVESALGIFRQYKKLAEKAIAQLPDNQLFEAPDKESNSIAIIMKHMSGNMLSRWTDFLTSDGEKSWRDRDSEFEMDSKDRAELMKKWEEGWTCLFNALEPLTPSDLGKIVKIRSEDHSVLEAMNRQIAHYSYHIGQIVFLAKMFRSDKWETLSIARGKSKEFNEKMK